MNLYLRYFNQETLVHNVDEALEFLNSIPDITVDDDMKQDLIGYAESNVTYPKRYKIQPRVYFIVIKTTAETMEEFKANSKKGTHEPTQQVKNPDVVELCERRPGWYEGALMFKRVIPIPGTGKFQYRDTSPLPVSLGQGQELQLQISGRDAAGQVIGRTALRIQTAGPHSTRNCGPAVIVFCPTVSLCVRPGSGRRCGRRRNTAPPDSLWSAY